MRITILSKIDYAGSAYKLCEALLRHTDHDVNLYSGKPENNFNHPVRNLVTKQVLNAVQQIDNKKIFEADGVVINYGNTKPAKEREDTYRRRKKAWDHGLDHNYGVHYLEGRMKHWRWDRSELVDIRTTDFGRYIKKLSNDISCNTNRGKAGSV